MKQIHGHEVMEMMLRTGKKYTQQELKEDILLTFGEDVRFFTCSAENMTAEEIIHFLANKGKFILSDQGFNTHPSKICDH